MTFVGDSRGIGLPDVLHSLEASRKTGLLVVEIQDEPVPWHLALVEGALVAVGREHSPRLAPAEVLVRWGRVGAKELEHALRRQKRSRGKKSLGEILVASGVLELEDYRDLMARIVEEEALDCLSGEAARFTFEEGEPASESFDPEQLWVGLALSVGPLLLEAARRIDEWERIRRNIGSDHEVFLGLSSEEEEPEEAVEAAVLEALDGEVELADLLETLPFTRFEIMKALSSLIEAGRARSARPEELCRMAESDLAAGEGERAIRRLRGALEVHRHDPELRVRLAETLLELGEQQEAAAELALAAQDLEAVGQEEEARALLERAVELRPAEPALRARLLLLCFKARDLERIKVQGLDLARLYLSLGLAEKALKILERLLEEGGLEGDPQILLELAHVASRAGRCQEATATLLGLASQEAAAGREDGALECYERALAIDPECVQAQAGLEELRSGAAARRRAFRNRIAKVSLVAVLSCTGFIFAMHEVTARVSLARVHDLALEETLWGRPAVAIPAVRALVAGHPWTFAAVEARRLKVQLAELQLEQARFLVRQGRPGEAAVAMLRLKENAPDLLSRAAWWPLLGQVIQQGATGRLSPGERTLIQRYLGRLTGLARADLVEWRLWWLRSGIEFLPRDAGRFAPDPPRRAGPPE